MGRRILRCRTWPLGVSPLSALQKAHPYSLPGKPLQTLEQIIIRQPSREQRKRTCGQVSKRNLLHSDTVGRKLCRLRRNDDYHCNGAGNRQSKGTTERNLDGGRLRPLLALYGAGCTHFL